LPGVRSTRVGWLDGREVVDVRFDPALLSGTDVLRAARESGCADRVWVAGREELERARDLLGERAQPLRDEPSRAQASDEKYYLGNSPLRFLPLTPLQVTRLNSVLGRGGDSGSVLSPRQFLLSERIQARLERDPQAFAALEPAVAVAELARYGQDLERILGAR